jgi:hypothetical protein
MRSVGSIRDPLEVGALVDDIGGDLLLGRGRCWHTATLACNLAAHGPADFA